MEHFLINSSACLFVLWLFYKLTLENTSWHYFKRYYLLSAIVVSIIIPFIVVKTIVIPLGQTPLNNINNSPLVTNFVTQSSFKIDWNTILIIIYTLGVLIMSWRFIKNINTFSIKQDDEITSYTTYQLVLRNITTVPHSFLQRIFVSKEDYEKNNIPQIVLEHEKAHLDQKHSLDILFIELLLILLWFNPLLYILRYSIKLNHEFLADRTVIKQGVNTTVYQKTLLNYAQQNHSALLANTFHFPIIKKRFHIMKTQTSQTSLFLRSLALIPILALLVISCGKEDIEFQEVEEIIEMGETSSNKKQIIIDDSTSNGHITIQDQSYYYNIIDSQVEIYDRFGVLQNFEEQGYKVLIISEEVIEEIPNPLNVIEYINTHKNDLNYYLKRKEEVETEKGKINADMAIKIIETLGQNDVEISPDFNDQMSIKINLTMAIKIITPPQPPTTLTKEGYISRWKNILLYDKKR